MSTKAIPSIYKFYYKILLVFIIDFDLLVLNLILETAILSFIKTTGVTGCLLASSSSRCCILFKVISNNIQPEKDCNNGCVDRHGNHHTITSDITTRSSNSTSIES